MGTKDPRIDQYIMKAQPFAKPILEHLRALIHQAVPDVQETVKWGMPSFDYKGPFAGMAAFKQHCTFMFWKAQLLNDPKGYLGKRKAHGGEAMGHLGCIGSISDLPPNKALLDLLKQAKKLNDDGVKLPSRAKKETVEMKVPDYFTKALKKNLSAHDHFKAFTPGKRKEYIEWLEEAKTEATREKRLAQAIEWIAEGKSRNWKYQK